jgi:hypothetical protein
MDFDVVAAAVPGGRALASRYIASAIRPAASDGGSDTVMAATR